MDAAARQASIERLLGDTGMSLITGLAWSALERDRPAFDAAALRTVERWFGLILAAGAQADYSATLPAALFLHSPGKGRGKTHIAAGAVHAARAAHKLAVFLEESSYLARRWGCAFEDVGQVVGVPGSRAWLTVIDDLGQRAKAGESVQNVWYEVINGRWLRRGWTIITSNWTLEELATRGTIGEATYSRLRQMTRGLTVRVGGADQRLYGQEGV